MEFNKLYSFIISPGEVVKDEIKRFKASCKAVVGSYPSQFSKAHVTLYKEHPERPSVMRRTSARLKQALQAIPATKLKINGFGYFENGANGFVIYAKIEMTAHLTQWLERLKLTCEVKEQLSLHITIARGLTARQFNLLWPHFKESDYRRSFMAGSLIILEKDMLNEQPSLKVAELPLGNKDVVLPQVWTLFNSPVYAG